MAALDTIAPNYFRAKQVWPGAPTLAKSYDSLSACYSTESHGLVENTKAFIETVCRTIISEYGGEELSSNPSTTDLLKSALKVLGLEGTKGVSKLDKVLSSFNRLSDALTEARNESGPVAHGKDGFLDALTSEYQRAFVLVGDVLLGLLLNALEGTHPDLRVTREPYENFGDYNSRIDKAVHLNVRVEEADDLQVAVFSVGVGPEHELIEVRVEVSRLLYGVDRQAYIGALQSASTYAARPAPDAEGRESTVLPEPSWLADQEAAATPVSAGSSEAWSADDLARHIATSIDGIGRRTVLTRTVSEPTMGSLAKVAQEHMYLDWERREAVQAAMRVALKRTLTQEGFSPNDGEVIAAAVVQDLRNLALAARA